MNFRERFLQFMNGRHGIDTAFYVLMAAAAVLAFLNLFLTSRILQIAVYVLSGFALYRFFSKDNERRRRENEFVIEAGKRFRQKRELYERRRNDRCHVYRKCPSCKAVLRLPRRAGVHQTVCPKCGRQFTVKVRKS